MSARHYLDATAARTTIAMLMLLMLPGVLQHAAAQAPAAQNAAEASTPVALTGTAAPATIVSAPAPAPAASPTGIAPEQETPMPLFDARPAATTDSRAPVLTDAAIRQAVRDIIAEDPHLPPASGTGAAYSGGATQARLNAAFDQARVPDCLHADALKHQPATLGPFTISGPYTLPWLLSAALRGKCR